MSSIDNTEILTAIVNGVKASSSLPSPDGDFQYYHAFPAFNKPVGKISNRILKIISRLMQQTTSEEVRTADIGDLDQFNMITDVSDTLCEKTDLFLDAMGGEGSVNQQLVVTKSSIQSTHPSSKGMASFSSIAKSQASFKDTIDNSHARFVHKLVHKHNAIVPLNVSGGVLPSDVPSAVTGQMKEGAVSVGGDQHGNNPYETEIRQWEPSPEQLVQCTPTAYRSMDEPCIWVNSLELLQEMIDTLLTVKQVSIDLEAHDLRSYQGFLCLMQVSTRTQDWIVDVLLLRENLPMLNIVTSDPAIEKVLHGADMDIVWFQRDFGVYIVNMFDTGQATRLLEYPSFGLAYLLKHHCGVTANKKFQLADWRVRPLTDEMMKYAREDTHYLLYIADCLRNELILKSEVARHDLLRMCYMKSRELCLQSYSKPLYHFESYMAMVEKHRLKFSNKSSMSVFAALHQWRDDTAREYDESVRYIMPNHILIKLADVMPTTVSQLHSCCNPVPPLVSVKAHDVVTLIAGAKLKPSVARSSLGADTTANGATIQQVAISTKSASTKITSAKSSPKKSARSQLEEMFIICDELPPSDFNTTLSTVNFTKEFDSRPFTKASIIFQDGNNAHVIREQAAALLHAIEGKIATLVADSRQVFTEPEVPSTPAVPVDVPVVVKAKTPDADMIPISLKHKYSKDHSDSKKRAADDSLSTNNSTLHGEGGGEGVTTSSEDAPAIKKQKTSKTEVKEKKAEVLEGFDYSNSKLTSTSGAKASVPTNPFLLQKEKTMQIKNKNRRK